MSGSQDETVADQGASAEEEAAGGSSVVDRHLPRKFTETSWLAADYFGADAGGRGHSVFYGRESVLEGWVFEESKRMESNYLCCGG